MGIEHIRKATAGDACRIAEIIIFNYRLNFYHIFRDDAFYFGELQVFSVAEQWSNDENALEHTFVYDDGTVKGMIQLSGQEIKKLFVEPVLHGNGIGKALLDYAVEHCGASFLWAMEMNKRAVRFYQRNGFELTGDKRFEEDTTEYLVRMEKNR